MNLLNTLVSIFVLPPRDDVESDLLLSTWHDIPEGMEKFVLLFFVGINTLISHCLTCIEEHFDPGATECIKIIFAQGGGH